MADLKSSLDVPTLKQFYPLSLLSDQLLENLPRRGTVKSVEAKGIIIRSKEGTSKDFHFLLSGEINVRLSFTERSVLDADDSQCKNPLEELIKSGGQVRASTPCEVLIVSRDVIDELLSWNQKQEFNVVHMDSGLPVVEQDMLVEDEEDCWTSVFLQSPMASHLSPSDLHNLFSQIEDVQVEQGEVVIKQNTEGDFFYIIKSGYAKVTSQSGPFADQEITLEAGNYFGDEALVAHTIRNATITMSTPGLLGRLNPEAFTNTVIAPLVKMLPEKRDFNYQYIDVRLPAEYQHGHRENSINLPISRLRTQLSKLDHSSQYVITPEGGRRSELATYLMRQAGFEAYLGSDEKSTDALAHAVI